MWNQILAADIGAVRGNLKFIKEFDLQPSGTPVDWRSGQRGPLNAHHMETHADNWRAVLGQSCSEFRLWVDDERCFCCAQNNGPFQV